jgi:hypothetical protein
MVMIYQSSELAAADATSNKRMGRARVAGFRGPTDRVRVGVYGVLWTPTASRPGVATPLARSSLNRACCQFSTELFFFFFFFF